MIVEVEMDDSTGCVINWKDLVQRHKAAHNGNCAEESCPISNPASRDSVQYERKVHLKEHESLCSSSDDQSSEYAVEKGSRTARSGTSDIMFGIEIIAVCAYAVVDYS